MLAATVIRQISSSGNGNTLDSELSRGTCFQRPDERQSVVPVQTKSAVNLSLKVLTERLARNAPCFRVTYILH